MPFKVADFRFFGNISLKRLTMETNGCQIRNLRVFLPQEGWKYQKSCNALTPIIRVKHHKINIYSIVKWQ